MRGNAVFSDDFSFKKTSYNFKAAAKSNSLRQLIYFNNGYIPLCIPTMS